MKSFQPFSVRRRFRSLTHAFAGLKILLQTQHNARIHAMAGASVLALAWWLEVGRIKFLFLIGSITNVWAAEAFNTTCEILLNIVAAKYSVKVKRAKDIAAAGVFLAVAGATATGLLILGPPFCRRLAHFFNP